MPKNDGDVIIENCSEEELQEREAQKLDSIFGLYASEDIRSYDDKVS